MLTTYRNIPPFNLVTLANYYTVATQTENDTYVRLLSD
jgi:hypothetical protein